MMVNTNKCPYCGGETAGSTADVEKVRCQYCRRWFAIPSKLDLEVQALYEQGKHDFEAMHYDEAEAAFKKLTELKPDYGEAYWQELLCHYKIEYVQDPDTGDYSPTIAQLTNASILESKLYQDALANTADDDLRASYMAEAQRINDILTNYRQLAHTHVYDVFISVKQGDAQGNPTRDSEEALRLTRFLTDHNLRVFNSRISLKDMAGREYEPYIMAGLLSAKAMIVVGSSRENLESQWVRNEWIRFRRLRDSGESKRILLPYLLDLSPKELPAEMGALQCIKNDSENAYAEILRAVYNAMPIDRLPSVTALSIPRFLPLSSDRAEQYLIRVQRDLAEYQKLEKRPMPDSATAQAAVNNMETICENLKSLRRSLDIAKLEQYALKIKDSFIAEFERLRLAEHKERLDLLEKKVSDTENSYESACSVNDVLQKIVAEARGFRFVVDSESVLSRASLLLKKAQGMMEDLNPGKIKSDPMRKALAVGKGFIAGLRRDGTLLIGGRDRELVQEAEQWRDITSIAAGDSHLVGLTRDGRVVAVGNNKKGQCLVQGLHNIKYIFACASQTFCLNNDGYCYALGDIAKEQREIIQCWRNIVFFSASRNHVVACDRFGKAYALGRPRSKVTDVSGLIDITQIFAVGDATIAIMADNHIDVLSDSPKQAAAQQSILNDASASFQSFVAQSPDSFVYLTRGRKLAFVGNALVFPVYRKLSEWKDVEEIAGNTRGLSLLGLRTDGTLISLKPNEMPKWYNLGLPQL